MIDLKKLFILFIVLTYFNVQAQQVDASLDTNHILIGDKVCLNIKINLPHNAKVNFPVFKDTLTAKVEVLNISTIDTLELPDNTIQYSQNIYITAFDSGNFFIPPQKISYHLSSDTSLIDIYTSFLTLHVKRIENTSIDELKDIKDIFSVGPLTFKELLPKLLIILLAILLIALTFKFIKNTPLKKDIIKKAIKPKVPPHTEALNSMLNLKKKKLWENNFIKEYYSELTDILRLYLEKGFEINAMEMTTDETLEAVSKSKINTESYLLLKNILVLSDLVKFAKHIPPTNEHANVYDNGITFIKNTTSINKALVAEAYNNSPNLQQAPQDKTEEKVIETKDNNKETE